MQLSDLNLSEMLTAVKLANVSYTLEGDPDAQAQVQAVLPGAVLGMSISAGGEFAFIADDGTNAWGVVRGSDNAVNWMQDLRFSQTIMSPDGQACHTGFLAGAKALASAGFTDNLRVLEATRRIILVGHSRGGAIITIIGHDFGGPATAYSFGGPRTFNPAGANAYPLYNPNLSSPGINLIRVCHDDDDVPRVPFPMVLELLRVLLYQHTAGPVNLADDGTLSTWPPEVDDLAENVANDLEAMADGPMIVTEHCCDGYVASIALALAKSLGGK